MTAPEVAETLEAVTADRDRLRQQFANLLVTARINYGLYKSADGDLAQLLEQESKRMSERIVDLRAGADNMPRQNLRPWGDPTRHVPQQGSIRWRERAMAAEAFIKRLEDIDRTPNENGDTWIDTEDVDALLADYKEARSE